MNIETSTWGVSIPIRLRTLRATFWSDDQKVDKVVNKTITDLFFSYEEPAVLLENMPRTTGSRTNGNSKNHEESTWLQNCSSRTMTGGSHGWTVVYWYMTKGCRLLDTDQAPRWLEQFFADDKASVVPSSYKDIVLSETGMHMMMLGPGDKERILETCRNIVNENTSNTETDRDVVSQM
jgi:hypothetical protein